MRYDYRLISEWSDVVAPYLDTLTLDSDPEQIRSECVNKIAQITYVSWELESCLLEYFEERLGGLRTARAARMETLLGRYADLIERCYQIVGPRASVPDEYGDFSFDVLRPEISRCVGKIAQREGVNEQTATSFGRYSALGEEARKQSAIREGRHILDEALFYCELVDRLEADFRRRVESRPPTAPATPARLSGVEFESAIARALQEAGFQDVRGTPRTGDQGADVIASRNGRSIVIQAKDYTDSVGNQAVQEAIGAKAFYNATDAWVVTTSTFTRSARELAYHSGIRLVEVSSSESLVETFRNLQ